MLLVQQFQNLRELKLSTIEVLLPVHKEQFQNIEEPDNFERSVLLPVRREQFQNLVG